MKPQRLAVNEFGMFAFTIENPHQNQHVLDVLVSVYEIGNSNPINTSLDLVHIPVNAPLKIEDTLETGYAFSRWPSVVNNRSVIELMCRVDDNEATTNFSKLIFYLTYTHLEGKSGKYEASIVVSFKRAEVLNRTRIKAQNSTNPRSVIEHSRYRTVTAHTVGSDHFNGQNNGQATISYSHVGITLIAIFVTGLI